jgi:pilus assembly protein FimV
VARERALNEANERIVHLEKTIKDMQTLMELKSPGMAAAQQQALQAAAPAPDAAKPESAKPEAAVALMGAPAADQPQPMNQPVAFAPKPQPKAASKPKAKPKPKEPELMDQVLEAATDPLYLGVGGGILVLGGLALWRRRRNAG